MAGLLNRAKMSTSTTGTGTVTLGSAVTGFLSFAEAGAVNATVYPYVIEDGDDFEIGIGTYTSSGTTFSRDTVTASKISGTAGTSKINLSGSATIFLTARAGDILNPANNLSDVAAAATAASNLGLGTSDSPQFAGINVGHATDTTITRTGAGDIAVEGNAIYRAAGTDVALADGGTGASTAAAARVNLGVRDVLSAARAYYVRTDGSDSNDGLTDAAGGAFLTLSKALSVIATIDFNGYTVTIQLGDGTYSSTTVSVPVTVGQATASKLVIQGNATTPANVVLSHTSGWTGAITAGAGTRVLVKNLKLTGNTNTYGLVATAGGYLEYSNIDFGSGGLAHMTATDGGLIRQVGAYAISGGSGIHFYAQLDGKIFAQSLTITLSGTPAFSNAFALASGLGVIVSQSTFSGSATGKRYDATSNALIQTYGAGANYFPGNSAGTTATGGLYQ